MPNQACPECEGIAPCTECDPKLECQCCGHSDHPDTFDVIYACEGSCYCPRCNQEISIETGIPTLL